MRLGAGCSVWDWWNLGRDTTVRVQWWDGGLQGMQGQRQGAILK